MQATSALMAELRSLSEDSHAACITVNITSHLPRLNARLPKGRRQSPVYLISPQTLSNT